jgi:hypothetical protein
VIHLTRCNVKVIQRESFQRLPGIGHRDFSGQMEQPDIQDSGKGFPTASGTARLEIDR